MSNKLVKTRAQAEREHTNGHAIGGKREKALPSFVTDTGYRIHYRQLSPETMPRLTAAAKLALLDTQPTMPTTRQEVGPGEFRDVDNPHDEAYQAAMEAWTAAVEAEAGARFLKLCEDYALIYEIDAEEVALLRAVHQTIGDPLDDLSDTQVFLWRIALPAPDDQLTIYAKLFGGLTEEAIQAQKASFLGNLQGRVAQASA